ncbi:MAG TPA: hypothetical protein VIB98_08720 [Gemmatimonadaceae bacterium]|jgi:hypothetical protein
MTEPVSYILPIRSDSPSTAPELRAYIEWIGARAEVIVVDGSSAPVFAAHEREWGSIVRHVPPAPDLISPMGKVGAVLTGLRAASHERTIIADDDVRYDDESLAQVIGALVSAHVVRPQNYFEPLPWHARWDTGRMLLNRLTGGDWPGTLGVRRSILQATNGYDGSVMFENLELVRTVLAAGGREAVLLGAYVRRRPSTARHFRGQRVRQAYDEIARPARFAIQLAILPVVLTLAITRHWLAITILAAAVVLAAEMGRRREGATRVFPPVTPLFAPLWLAERAVCSWLALGARILLGGVPYRGTILHHAATPMRVLRRRHSTEAQSRSA